jgi:redox-sensitive bicupin YhaK (pirin superfamily)
VDLRLQPGARFEQELPDSYNGFLNVLEGDVAVEPKETRLAAGQVGWLADAAADVSSVSALRITAGESGARLVLYAGERQDVPLVFHGPFVGESRADLMRLSKLYVDGKMPRISELAQNPNREPTMTVGATDNMAEATSGDRNR